MIDLARQRLRELYGYPDFRGPQEAVIAHVLAGRDVLVLMPTGGGKSLCYQLPAVLREGCGLVVSPLIALMQDQVAALRQVGVSAAYLNSTLSAAAQRAVLEEVRDGRLDLLYVAPERLLQQQTLDFLAAQRIALIAVDEAHCVSQWGHDFRQDYLGLAILGERFPGVPRLALTATADLRTREEIVDRLALRDPARFVSGFDRPNIRYAVGIKSDPRRQLGTLLARHRGEAGIVYCLSRDKTESTAAALCADGFDALPYHAGLPAETRSANQERFLREDGVIMVATIAFGMGIDKPDVRFVAHLDLPKSMEAYYQETGRAGRDGAPAEAWMVYGLQDVVRLRQMADQSVADEQIRRIERHKLDSLLGWCEITTCRRRALLAYFGEERREDCGNCDVCLEPPARFDASEAARQLLSCVYRTGQRFGAAHVIDVLTGRETEKVKQYRHEHLSTFGIGQHYDAQRWNSILRQLVVRGFLRQDVERYGALALTEEARPLLRGEIALELREDSRRPAAKKSRLKAPVAGLEQDPLWEALRACRRQLALAQGVPPYVVFHDATLAAMATHRPATLAQLSTVNGVGAAKLERYGQAFLDVLNAHAAETGAGAGV
ncbi:MAG: DNA helicase RecQ [Gammaproteobacteria bacterium]|nr:DNA helicase RecQ [Gammaproteobacteria bacterium]